ncbi:MAG: hypothetical protein JXA89_02065 [Anaerolineae bacterium]|nr:hypothetical protein [Anaerolineae bacterium]
MNQVEPRSPLWKRLPSLLWRGRFLYLQGVIIAAAVWLLWPLRDAVTLPDPAVPPLATEPPDRQETVLVGTERFSPGTQGVVRVLVYDPDSREPMPGVDVQASISSTIKSYASESVFSGQTDAYGGAAVVFDIPADTHDSYGLVIDTAGPVGAQRIIHPLVVQRRVQLDLTTDNVLYHPGQFIYLSLLASDGLTDIPLPDQPITLTVVDAHQNPIWTESATTSEFGLAAAECELADKIDGGVYRIMAVLDVPGQVPVSVEKTVRVEPVPFYSFDIAFSVNDEIYLPGQHLSVTVRVNERWGQPISGTQITIQPALYTPAQHNLKRVGEITGADGKATLDFFLPENLPAADGQPPFALGLVIEAVAPDGRTARQETRLAVASQAIRVRIRAESGALKPGLENVIYLQTTYPDNRPASCTIEIEANDQNVALTTDQYGLAWWHYTPIDGQPLSLQASAQDQSGHSGQASLTLAIEPGRNHLVLRPRQNTIDQNEPIWLDVFAASAGRVVYLDVQQSGQTIATYSAPLSQDRASLSIKAAPVGTLTLYAYMLLDDGTFVGDAKTVTVLPHASLQFSARAARTLYEPGETAQVEIQISDGAGIGMPGALETTLVGVTQAGLFLSESDARPFWVKPDGAGDVTAAPAKLFVRYAGALSKPRPVPEQVRREFERIAAVRAERQQAFARLAGTFIIALAAASALMWIVVLVWAWRADKMTWKALFAGLLSSIVVLPLALGGTILLVHFGQQIFGPGASIVLGLGWLGALLALPATLRAPDERRV